MTFLNFMRIVCKHEHISNAQAQFVAKGSVAVDVAVSVAAPQRGKGQ